MGVITFIRCSTVQHGHGHLHKVFHCTTWAWLPSSGIPLYNRDMVIFIRCSTVQHGHGHLCEVSHCTTWAWSPSSGIPLYNMGVASFIRYSTVYNMGVASLIRCSTVQHGHCHLHNVFHCTIWAWSPSSGVPLYNIGVATFIRCSTVQHGQSPPINAEEVNAWPCQGISYQFTNTPSINFWPTLHVSATVGYSISSSLPFMHWLRRRLRREKHSVAAWGTVLGSRPKRWKNKRFVAAWGMALGRRPKRWEKNTQHTPTPRKKWKEFCCCLG